MFLGSYMTTRCMLVFFAVFLLCVPVRPEEFPVYYSSDSSSIEFDETGKQEEIILQGNVKIVLRDTTILCNSARFNRATGDITAEGPLSVQTSQGTFKTDYITYNINEKSGVLLNASFSMPPLYGRADKIEKKEAFTILDNGYITTCDLEKPHYRVSAESIEYVQDDYIRAKKMKLTFGEKFSVLYLPRFTFDVKNKEAPFIAGPGYSTRIGKTLDITFSQRAVRETDAVVKERLSLGSEALGLGLEFFSNEGGYSSSGFVCNRWEGGLEAGGLLEFGKSYSSHLGTGRVIIDWRWMYNEEFFNDFFHSEFIEKSKNYNYFSFTHNLWKSILNLNIRESADEDFLEVERLPELQFYTPYLQIADLPLFIENDFRLTRFYKGGEDYLRTVGISTLKSKKDMEFLTFAPYLSLGGVNYHMSSAEDKLNLMGEIGTRISTTLKRETAGYTGYFTPAISLFYRGLDYKPGEIEPFDVIEGWDDGKFVSLQTEWFFMENDASYLGRISFENPYSIDRGEFDGSFLRYDLKLTPQIYIEGENEWDLNKTAYKFGVNDIVMEKGRYNYSLGNRYNEEDDTSGIATRFEHTVSQNWRYAVEAQYDINSGSLTRKGIEIWRKLHCWEMNIRIYADEDDYSFFILVYPIFL